MSLQISTKKNKVLYVLIPILLLTIVAGIAYLQQGNTQPVSTKAALVNKLSWEIFEPEITVSSKIYRTTTDFLEDPDDQYLIATVASPTKNYDDTDVSADITYYYSIFLIDDADVVFDPSYAAMIPEQSSTGGGGSGGGGSSGGGGGGGGSGSGGGGVTPPPPVTSGTNLVNSNGTFYFIENGFRKGITSPGIMYACGFEFKDARAATAADLSLPTTLLLPCAGSLVKSKEDPTVYLISGGTRYAFTSGLVFLRLGFKFSSVLIVTNPELQELPRGNNLSDGSAAHLPGTDINVNGTVYWIESNMTKRPYPSTEVYNTWHVDGDFSTVVPANSNDLGLTTGSIVPARVF